MASKDVFSSTVTITGTNDLMSEIHHHMPVILSSENYGVWLDPDFDEREALTSLLKPYPADAMEAYQVSRRVNKPSNNEPSVVEPAA